MIGKSMYKNVILAFFLFWTVFSDKTIKIQNNCNKVVSAGLLTNGKGGGLPEKSMDLPPGGSGSVSESDTWGGRIWGRYQCSGSASKDVIMCGIPGATSPATLAEFLFKGSNGNDYYDISLVDGFNIHMAIAPSGGGASNGYSCGTPQCSVPSCPGEFAAKDSGGNVIGCKSACSVTNSPEDCCTGSYNNPDVCKGGSQAQSIKAACPDAYSFAYDDQTSTYSCGATGYVVTFC